MIKKIKISGGAFTNQYALYIPAPTDQAKQQVQLYFSDNYNKYLPQQSNFEMHFPEPPKQLFVYNIFGKIFGAMSLNYYLKTLKIKSS